MSSRIPGFYRLSVAERRDRLAEAGGLAADADRGALDDGGLDVGAADDLIENVIGIYALPLAVALNFTVDDVDCFVPMAVEEPSIVAAASNAAKMIRAGGGFRTQASRPVMIGQIQIVRVPDVEAGAAALAAARDQLLASARAMVPRLVARGGGPVDLEIRPLTTSAPDGPDGGVIVVHLLVDCRDAMGANLVNTLCEGLADPVAALAGGAVGLRILSNLNDERTVTVTARVPDAALAPDGVHEAGHPHHHGAAIRGGITAASRFAELDPYRAATHNKGIMNGIDAVLLATGQDWRAVEAGAHAWAARDGRYRPLAVWRDADPEAPDGGGALIGELTLPLAVGTVGGALHVHRAAKLALGLAGVANAARLAAVAAAAGLATNLAALRALATDGIQRGHMSLHARVVARAAGATGDLVERVAAEIAAAGDVKAERAREILDRLRGDEVAHLEELP